MSPVPFSRRDRLTSAVGPDAIGSNPGLACAQMPERSGKVALLLPGAAGCPEAVVTAAAATVTSNRKFRDRVMLPPRDPPASLAIILHPLDWRLKDAVMPGFLSLRQFADAFGEAQARARGRSKRWID